MGRTLNRGETARPRTPGRGDGVRLSYDARKKSLTSGPGWSAAGNDACASAACGWARDWAGVPGFGPSDEERGPARKGILAFGPSGDKGCRAAWRREWAARESHGPRQLQAFGPKRRRRRKLFFSFSDFSSKQIRNAISTQFKIRPQPRNSK